MFESPVKKSDPLRKNTNVKSDRLVILFSWLCMQIFLFWTNGIEIGGEAGKYIFEANRLLAGDGLSSGNYRFYIVTIALIAVSIKLNLGFLLPLVIQLVLNLVATARLYSWSKSKFGQLPALIATSGLIFFFPYQEFNTFLQTESIFFSLLIILSCYLFKMRQLGASRILVLCSILLLMIFTRPTGILFVAVTGCYLYFRFFRFYRFWVQATIYGTTAVLFLVSLILIMTSGGELDFMLPFIQQHIICGVPTLIPQVADPAHTDHGIFAVLKYVVKHPKVVFDLAAKRTTAFFGLRRSYYSELHNTVVATTFFTLYLFSAGSLPSWWKKDKAILFYLLSGIGITWITAMLTCDDWHNRFILSVYPLFIILSLPLLTRLVRKLTKSSGAKDQSIDG